VSDTIEDDLKTVERDLDSITFERARADRDTARRFVHFLTEAARTFPGAHDWSIDEIIEVIRFAMEGGPTSIDFFDGSHFFRCLEDTLERAQRYKEDFSVMVIRPGGGEGGELVDASVLDGLVERLRRSDQAFLFKRRVAIILPYTGGKDLSTLIGRIQELFEGALGPEIELQLDHMAYPVDLGSAEEITSWVKARLE